MEEENEREKVAWKIEGRKGEKLNFEVCLTRLSFIKVMTSVTHVSIHFLNFIFISCESKKNIQEYAKGILTYSLQMPQE